MELEIDPAFAHLQVRDALRINIGDYCILKSRPCLVVDYKRSKPGKHGHGKVFLVGVDLFTTRKYEDIFQFSKPIPIPVVNCYEYRLIGIEEGGIAQLEFGVAGLSLPDGEARKWVEEMVKTGTEVWVKVMKVDSEQMIVAVRVKEEDDRDD